MTTHKNNSLEIELTIVVSNVFLQDSLVIIHSFRISKAHYND